MGLTVVAGLYKVTYDTIVIRRHIPALPQTMRERIEDAVEKRLMVNPVACGKPLQHSLRGHRRMRVGDYRIVYKINTAQWEVIAVGIGHRKDIYEG